MSESIGEILTPGDLGDDQVPPFYPFLQPELPDVEMSNLSHTLSHDHSACGGSISFELKIGIVPEIMGYPLGVEPFGSSLACCIELRLARREGNGRLELAPPVNGVPTVEHYASACAPPGLRVSSPVGVRHDNDVWVGVLKPIEQRHSWLSLKVANSSLDEYIIPGKGVTHPARGDSR